jgi:hypothetical protein
MQNMNLVELFEYNFDLLALELLEVVEVLDLL